MVYLFAFNKITLYLTVHGQLFFGEYRDFLYNLLDGELNILSCDVMNNKMAHITVICTQIDQIKASYSMFDHLITPKEYDFIGIAHAIIALI